MSSLEPAEELTTKGLVVKAVEEGPREAVLPVGPPPRVRRMAAGCYEDSPMVWPSPCSRGDGEGVGATREEVLAVTRDAWLAGCTDRLYALRTAYVLSIDLVRCLERFLVDVVRHYGGAKCSRRQDLDSLTESLRSNLVL